MQLYLGTYKTKCGKIIVIATGRLKRVGSVLWKDVCYSRKNRMPYNYINREFTITLITVVYYLQNVEC